MRNALTPVGYGIVVKDFLDRSLDSRKWFTGAKFRTSDGKALTSGCPTKSYYVPFQWCVLNPAKVSRNKAVEKIHFFAGLDRTFYRYASVLYKHLLSDPRLPASFTAILGQISFPLAKDTLGIQAADLFVNRFYQHMIQVASTGKVPEPPPCQHL